jgi:SAM-dependent methyltransferase
VLPPRPPGHQRFSIFHATADDETSRRAWHHAYADVFRGCASVLDVGCGTGVFLDLLRERGVARRLGIDRDPEMVEESRTRGHDVQLGDVRVALRTLGECFEGIHVSFVIETMDGEEGLAFLADCVRALHPNGTLVVRTLNPRNAAVREGAFWYEPWAKRPWPLETLHVAFADLGLRIVGAGYEPEGWEHLYVVGRAAPAVGEEAPVAVAWQGEFFAYNSMAVVNRELARALLTHADVAPLLVPDEPREEPSVAADPRNAA